MIFAEGFEDGWGSFVKGKKGDMFHFDVKFAGRGNDWVAMATHAVGVNFENRNQTEKTTSFPRLTNKVTIRFRGGGNDNSRKVFLDDVTFCGLSC